MKNNILIIIIVALLVVGAGTFFAGMKYQESKRPVGSGQFQRRGGFRPVNGEIISQDENSITVKLQDGSSKIILLTNTTTFNKSAEGSKADLKVGEKVAVFGSENSDGSVTGQNIQLSPRFTGGTRRQANQSVKSPDAKEIVVEGSNYKFNPDAISVKKGQKIRILFKNTNGMHDFRIDELNIATGVIQDGREDFVEFTPDKTGTFEFYCSVDSHRQMGMVGKLTVE